MDPFNLYGQIIIIAFSALSLEKLNNEWNIYSCALCIIFVGGRRSAFRIYNITHLQHIINYLPTSKSLSEEHRYHTWVRYIECDIMYINLRSRWNYIHSSIILFDDALTRKQYSSMLLIYDQKERKDTPLWY